MSPAGLQPLQASDRAVLPPFPQTKECPERPVECKFCGAAVRLSKLEIHEHHCGNRTELCLACGQLVVLRVLPQHGDTCQSKQAPRGTGERGGRGGKGRSEEREPLLDGVQGV